MKRLLSALVLLLALCGCAPQPNCSSSSEPALRVLFIGNSYTYVNDLPGTFTELACSGGRKVETGMQARPGWALDDHANSAQTLDVLEHKTWDIVVLQDQSEVPALEYERTHRMVPSGRFLVRKVRERAARPVFFQTWGHRDGLPSAGLANYQAMQSQLDLGYRVLADELKVPVAPVGDAWSKAVAQSPPLSLWQDDGSHPTPQGTYLAACVFYAVLLDQSPEGLSYRAGLPESTAHSLQSLAADAAGK